MKYLPITWDPVRGIASKAGIPINFSYVDPFLGVADAVILTQPIVESILATRQYFQASELWNTEASSGYRDPDHQLRVIIGYLAKYKLLNIYPEIKQGIAEKWNASIMVPMELTVGSVALHQIYWWQRGWSRLLGNSIKLIINPAFDAVCLEHSTRDNATDRYSDVIHQTPHAFGLAYDIAGGDDHDPSNEYKVLLEAQKNPICNIRNLTLERKNNCVHVDIIE